MAPERRRSDATHCLYLYCLTDVSLTEEAVIGLEGMREQTSFPKVIQIGGLWAIVDEVLLDAWTGVEGETHMKDLEWVGPRAFRHEEVVERIMEAGPVYPMPFGTLFSDRDALEDALAEMSEQICSFLAEVRGKNEWEVRGLLDRERLRQHLLETINDGAIASDGASAGASYLLRKRRERDLDEHLRRWLNTHSSHDFVTIDARTSASAALAPRRQQERDDGLEVITKWAFLIAEEHFDEVVALVESLNAEHADAGLSYEMIGPWPPYNFRHYHGGS